MLGGNLKTVGLVLNKPSWYASTWLFVF